MVCVGFLVFWVVGDMRVMKIQMENEIWKLSAYGNKGFMASGFGFGGLGLEDSVFVVEGLELGFGVGFVARVWGLGFRLTVCRFRV